MSSVPTCRRAFTLLELLVVVLILVVLVAILIPSMSWAKRRANLAKCASNQRQLAMATMEYATNWQGSLPVAAGNWVAVGHQYNSPYWPPTLACWLTNEPFTLVSGATTTNWRSMIRTPENILASQKTGAIYPYIRNNSYYYYCPGDTRLAQEIQRDEVGWSSPNGIFTSYMMNIVACPQLSRPAEWRIVRWTKLTNLHPNGIMYTEFGNSTGYSEIIMQDMDFAFGRYDVFVGAMAKFHASGEEQYGTSGKIPAAIINVACFDGHVEQWNRARANAEYASNQDPHHYFYAKP